MDIPRLQRQPSSPGTPEVYGHRDTLEVIRSHVRAADERKRAHPRGRYFKDCMKRRKDPPWLRRAKLAGAMTFLVFIIGVVVAAPVVGTQLAKKGKPSNSTSPTSPASPTGGGSPVATPSPDEIAIGSTFRASFTYYGSGDNPGAPACNTLSTSCGFYTNPGYSSAVSQNLYGAGPGGGVGIACGTCWKLTAQADAIGTELTNASSIVVMANDLCQAAGNGLCGQHNLTGTNQYGAQVAFDLCLDTGAPEALFGTPGVVIAIGIAKRVYCEEWQGRRIPPGGRFA